MQIQECVDLEGAFHNNEDILNMLIQGKSIRGNTEMIGLINSGDKMFGAVIFLPQAIATKDKAYKGTYLRTLYNSTNQSRYM